MGQIKNRYNLAIEPGEFIQIQNGDCHILSYIENWEDAPAGTSGYRCIDVCWLWIRQKELQKRLIDDGDFTELESGYKQYFAAEPLTQEQFDDMLSHVGMPITIQQFAAILPKLKDGLYFVRWQGGMNGKGETDQSVPVKIETPAPSAPSTPSPATYLTIDQILNIISGLAKSQGFYGRVLQSILEHKKEDPKGYAEWCENVEGMNFTDTLEIVLYLEEGKLPKNYVPKKPEAAPKSKNAKYPGVGRCTQRVLDLVSTKTGAAIKRIARQQLEKYGNDDLFDISIQDDRITVTIGENWITFFFEPNQTTINDTTGYGQSGRYHKLMETIAVEARRAQLEGRLS